jgi:hypothetical protein
LFFLLSACGWESATLSPLPASAHIHIFRSIAGSFDTKNDNKHNDDWNMLGGIALGMHHLG